ncbi:MULTISPECIES: hypothetical protein [unclassified Streptomyces]|uniref:hypothetical protein n=1 Tax=unclassified Streptomyces TaxID=2593676 RepID=UPI002DDAAEDE|nr:hypothetical protein [Streptomyces sp. NBC_01750]WSA99041.1 hypothetical protein OIE54_07075 [Streptomyces sp. NBC_01794]WSD36393.1 hypothetical protein OG966_33510 [Streptomyces sp. NBC_01750]
MTDHFTADELPKGAGVRDARMKGKKLTLGQYPAVLNDAACWVKLRWPYEQQDMVHRVTVVKDYRNELAHWDVDAPEEKTEALAATKQLLNLLKLIDHDPLP